MDKKEIALIKPKAFKTQADFRAWLSKNHGKQEGLWIRFYKKASGVKAMGYPEALEEALCFGWIDSVAYAYDDKSYMQKFSPRRSRSMWSQVNIKHIDRLTKAGKMMQPGLAAVTSAKADGRWERAYHPQSAATIPGDLQRMIDKNKKMKAFAATLNKANIFAITYRLSTAKKPETRERRFKMIVEMLKKGQKFH